MGDTVLVQEEEEDMILVEGDMEVEGDVGGEGTEGTEGTEVVMEVEGDVEEDVVVPSSLLPLWWPVSS